jgi:hypothetical protein
MPDLPRRLSKFTSAPTALLILLNRNLRLSRMHTLNDPFDGYFQPYWILRKSENKRAVGEYFRRLLNTTAPPITHAGSQRLQRERERLATLPPNERSEAIDQLLSSGFVDSLVGGITSHAERAPLQERILVLSMCGDYLHSDLLMWSHYADGHQGARIDFDPAALVDSTGLRVLPVNYIDAPTTPQTVNALLDDMLYDVRDPKVVPEIVKLGALSKSSSWSYEAEWRCIDGDDARDAQFCKYVTYSRDAIRGVTLGCRVAAPHEAAIRKVCSTFDPPLPVTKLKRCPTSFALEVDDARAE